MKTSTKNPTTVFNQWMRFLGVMLMVALMVPAIAFSQPALLSPANLATNVSTSPIMSWTTAAGDSLYYLQVDTSIVFGTMLHNDTVTVVPDTITGLRNSTKYYWHVSVMVNAAHGGTTSAFSAVDSFTTQANTPTTPAQLPVTLGLTSGFAILSYAGITDVPTSAITGNIGVSPTTGASIHPTQTEVVGTIYAVDAGGPAGSITFPSMLTQAMVDLTTAYNDAAGRTVNPIGVAGNLGGLTLYPGLYKSTGSLQISSGNLTLDAQGNTNAVWIFQIASSFNMTSGRQVILSGGAKASNIFWQVGSGATFGTTTVMKGTILAYTNITFATGASLEGRALARTASVTLQSSVIGGTASSPLHAVFLQSAANFRILAGSAVTIGSGCTVTGNVGLSPAPGSSITLSGSIIGTLYKTDATGPAGTVDATTLTTAKTDLDTAYNIAARQIPDSTLSSAELGGTTLNAGVYKSGAGTFSITSDTLKLNGNVNDVFIFKMTTTLTTGSASVVTLSGGALVSNVFWQVGSSATIAGKFKGNILALTAITQNSDSINGSALAENSFVTVNGASVLPVELVSFTGTVSGMNADLHWSTATEINNSGFEVQRRQTADWAKVGFVAGAGTSNAPRNYSYTDNNLTAGSYSYRLKQIDNNGAFTYGTTVEVAISSAPQAFALLQNYPNPFNPSTVIQYSLVQASQVSLKVYNMLGQEVATLVNAHQEAGVYAVPFNATKALSLSSGVYIYRLQAGSFISTKKLVLMK